MPDQKIPPLPINPIQLSYEQWAERFQPQKNHIDSNAGYDGCMFETYGDELKFVQGFDPAKVWTITSSGDYVVLGNGYHFVDRVGYLLSAAPCPGDEHYEIVIGEPDDELGEVDAMIEIQRLLDGEEWSPDTLDAIAEICRRAGYPVRDTSETTAE